MRIGMRIKEHWGQNSRQQSLNDRQKRNRDWKEITKGTRKNTSELSRKPWEK